MRLVCFILAVGPLVAACSDELNHVYVEVDRSQCNPACKVSRYEIVLQRQSTGGARCTFFSGTSTGSELVIPGLGLPAGAQIYVGLAAHCDAPPDLGLDQFVSNTPDVQPHPSPQCCAAQAKCLQNPSYQTCSEARNVCPPEGRPDSDPAWKAYHQKYCTGPDAGPPPPKPDGGGKGGSACVRCYALFPVTLTTARTVQSVLHPPPGCDVPELHQPECP